MSHWRLFGTFTSQTLFKICNLQRYWRWHHSSAHICVELRVCSPQCDLKIENPCAGDGSAERWIAFYQWSSEKPLLDTVSLPGEPPSRSRVAPPVPYLPANHSYILPWTLEISELINIFPLAFDLCFSFHNIRYKTSCEVQTPKWVAHLALPMELNVSLKTRQQIKSSRFRKKCANE